MSYNDILDMVGDAKGCYVWDAQQIRSGQISTVRRTTSRKVWLIAAVIAILLMLVGCTVAYVLRMQNLKVGEYISYIPTEYDEDGNVIPVETREQPAILSLQGVNMDALAEWVSFTYSYDQDLEIAIEADNVGNYWDYPDGYWLTYGCYSQEMVDKLNAIVEKYDLKLLSEYIIFEWWESDALLKSLSLDSLWLNDTGVEYLDGDMHPEGTFQLYMLLAMDLDTCSLDNNFVGYRYSFKEYFDQATDFMYESNDYQQWDYTRKDGKKVLLVLNDDTARIYVDLPDAFVSAHFDPVIYVDGEQKTMTQDVLEQLAELLDLDIKPKPVSMIEIEQYKAESFTRREHEKASAQVDHEKQYLKGYESFVQYRLEKSPNTSELSYILYDINGDGEEELIINSYEILSMKDGQSYKYCDLLQTGVFIPRFRPCEGGVFEVWTEDLGVYQHYFYQADAEEASFITGVTYEADRWYQVLTDGTDGQKKLITEAEAQEIMSSYRAIDFDWLPLKRYGETIMSITYTDPYARYIARKLERYEKAETFAYTLLDLNEDGIEELITQEIGYMGDGREFPILYVHSIKNGELWDMNSPYMYYSYVLEGGMLEIEEMREPDGVFYSYFQITKDGIMEIEKVVRDPATLYWGHAVAGQEGKTVTKEKAMSIIDTYKAKRIELDMRPFEEYPFK